MRRGEIWISPHRFLEEFYGPPRLRQIHEKASPQVEFVRVGVSGVPSDNLLALVAREFQSQSPRDPLGNRILNAEDVRELFVKLTRP